MGRKPRTIAFTLVEVVIAIAILGAIVTAIYSVWSAVLRASQVGLRAADSVQRERITRRTIEVALQGAQLWQENLSYYSFDVDTTDERFAFLSFVSRLPENFPGTGMFPLQPVRRVTFEVEDGTNGRPQLVMRQKNILSDTNGIDESYIMVLSTNVSTFSLEFWNTNLADWEVEWMSTNQLPQMVRLYLGFSSGSGQEAEHPITSIVSLSGTVVPKDVHRPNSPLGGGPPGAAPPANGNRRPNVPLPRPPTINRR